jgi:hypothetical protein
MRRAHEAEGGSDMVKSGLNPDGTVELSVGSESVSLTAREMDEQIQRLARVHR